MATSKKYMIVCAASKYTTIHVTVITKFSIVPDIFITRVATLFYLCLIVLIISTNIVAILFNMPFVFTTISTLYSTSTTMFFIYISSYALIDVFSLLDYILVKLVCSTHNILIKFCWFLSRF